MNWSLLQNGIGIDIREGRLRAVCVKRQLRRIRVEDSLEIPDYQQKGPQTCGEIYNTFLQKNGLKSPWTVVALPRSAVLLRFLQLPPAVETDLARVVEYQLDSLHPFEENSVYWSFTASKPAEKASSTEQAGGESGKSRIEILVAIAEKNYVDGITTWFQEAGIGISQFTVASAVLMAAIQPGLELRGAAEDRPSRSFLSLNAGQNSMEVAGYAPGVALVSKELPISTPAAGEDSEHGLGPELERELELMRSELRLSPEDRPPLVLCGRSLHLNIPIVSEELRLEVLPADYLFPNLSSASEEFDLREQFVAFAAALTAADRTLPYSLNLLPAEKRTYQSPLVYLPTYALSALIVVLSLALGLRGTVQDWSYNRYLGRQIEALNPQLAAVETAEQQSRKAFERIQRLGSVRQTALLPLQVLAELSNILPNDVWLQQMTYDGDTFFMGGVGKSASQILPILAGSKYFESPQLLSGIGKTADGMETFRIGARIKKSQ